MSAFAIQLLRSSCAMTAVALLYALAVRLLVGRYSPKSFYDVGRLALLGFLIPFRPTVTVSAVRSAASQSGGGTSPFPAQAFFYIWLAGAALVLLYHILRHARFLKTVNRWSRTVNSGPVWTMLDEEEARLGVRAGIKLRECGCVSSPMLVHAAILLPDRPLPEEDIRLILRHELVHGKRRDPFWKAALMCAAAVNWFNPAVYLFVHTFTRMCELSCDEEAARGMDESVRQQYALAILRMSRARPGKHSVFAPSFTGGKENMKNRLAIILHPVRKQLGPVALVLCLLLVLCCGISLTPGTAEAGQEMEKAFSEEFSREFDESAFVGMTVTYDENGVPIVADSTGIPDRESVFVKARASRNGFYATAECSDELPVFWVAKGTVVEVTDSCVRMEAAKVRYAGVAGYMKKKQLKF